MIEIPMTDDEFAKAKQIVETSNDVTLHTEVTPTSGTFATSQITAGYNYLSGQLQIVITAKHGLAKFASESVIQQHLEDMLKSL